MKKPHSHVLEFQSHSFRVLFSILIACWLVIGYTPSSYGAATITFTEVGPDVQASISGTLNTAGLASTVGTTIKGQVNPASALAVVGDAAASNSDRFSGITGPTSLGTGNTTVFAFSGSGGHFGVDLSAAPNNLLIVPSGFVNGATSGNSTWTSHSFVTLGLTPGTYTYTWGSDSLTIQIGPAPAPTAVPSLSEWMQLILILMVMTLIGWQFRKHQI
jgi:hypothetical protein